eukprot:m.145772 g.145772  ORF g.145772 m.145772 type:complete len:302 (-) comp9689_c2_seq1:117-1022(-)
MEGISHVVRHTEQTAGGEQRASAVGTQEQAEGGLPDRPFSSASALPPGPWSARMAAASGEKVYALPQDSRAGYDVPQAREPGAKDYFSVAQMNRLSVLPTPAHATNPEDTVALYSRLPNDACIGSAPRARTVVMASKQIQPARIPPRPAPRSRPRPAPCDLVAALPHTGIVMIPSAAIETIPPLISTPTPAPISVPTSEHAPAPAHAPSAKPVPAARPGRAKGFGAPISANAGPLGLAMGAPLSPTTPHSASSALGTPFSPSGLLPASPATGPASPAIISPTAAAADGAAAPPQKPPRVRK